MDDKTPPPRKGGHKLAAAALALVTVVIALGIFNANNTDADRAAQRACIASGAQRCGGPPAAIIGLVLFVGLGAAARAWKND